MIKKIDHVAVIVRDLDAAVKNYSDMFGFKLEEAREGPGGEFKSVHVRVNDGPFIDFVGVVDDISPGTGKVKVLLSIFGRETPVELDSLQVEKL